jgi:hypothetical protein
MKRDWHIIVAVLALVATLVGVAVQIGQGAGLFGADRAKVVSTAVPAPPPPIISKTGIVIEQKTGAAAGAEGSHASGVLLVTVPPDTGKWRQLLCRNDEILSIDGNAPTLRDAQQALYNDGGDKIVVRQFGDGQMIAVDSTGLARCGI